jgi:hypothetical protein
MPANHPGRRRSLDRNKKTQICDAVARGATVVEAAAALSVSVRTVQREARRDPDFDQQLRQAHAATPDPLKLMQSAARTHWRAAAWLLERTDPENYGRRPASACGPGQLEAALRTVLEAALEVVAPAERHAVYQHVEAACRRAFRTALPAYGPCGRRLQPERHLTLLADAERLSNFQDPNARGHIHDYEEPRPALSAIALEERTNPRREPPAMASTPRVPQEASPPAVDSQPAAPQHRRPWTFARRAAQTSPPATPTAAPHARNNPAAIPSPKTHFATQSPSHDKSTSPSSVERSAENRSPLAPREEICSRSEQTTLRSPHSATTPNPLE